MTWPAVETVAVELVPAAHRHGALADRTWVAVYRLPDRTMRVYLPDTAEERAAHPVEYGRKVAAEAGAVFAAPPSWLRFARLNETTWSAWDERRCAPHGRLGCRAASCAEDDCDITEPPIPTLALTTRPEVLV